jgi:hypothetical protein
VTGWSGSVGLSTSCTATVPPHNGRLTDLQDSPGCRGSSTLPGGRGPNRRGLDRADPGTSSRCPPCGESAAD